MTDTKLADLLPCPNPWCDEGSPIVDQLCADNWTVRCNTCDICAPVKATEAEAITAWQTRPSPTEEAPEQCHRCGHENAAWSAPSPLWNAVMRGGCINGKPLFEDMVCAACFMTLAEKAGIAGMFRVTADVVNVPLQTTTPSGRVWDDSAQMWANPSPTTIPQGAAEGLATLCNLLERVRQEYSEAPRELFMFLIAREGEATLASLRRPTADEGDALLRVKIALELGAQWFEEYADQHAEKAAQATEPNERAGRRSKAVRNAERANVLREAIPLIDAHLGGQEHG